VVVFIDVLRTDKACNFLKREYISIMDMQKPPMMFLSQFDHGDVMTVDEFVKLCEIGMFTDYDGFGYSVYGDRVDNQTFVIPSKRADIPDLATHIIWFNR